MFELDTNSNSKTLADIDGDDSIFYWVDLTTEMAFYLPHQFSRESILSFFCMYFVLIIVDNQSSEMRILIVWLEEFRDDLDSVLPGLEILIDVQISMISL